MTGPEVVALARAWIGTPYVTGAAVRGVGADCIGLVRGVFAEVTGREPERPPGWRRDWSADSALPLLAAAARNLTARPLAEAAPGDVVVVRIGRGRLSHAGILTDPGRMIHAAEGAGVREVTLGAWRDRVAFAFAFPGVARGL